MTLVRLRLWLPDRPGALGSVASRIGGVGADVVGIEIVERGGGRVVDELIIDLPAGVPEDLLVREVAQVDGVAVEDVCPAPAYPEDARVEAFERAAALVACGPGDQMLRLLCAQLVESFEAGWAVVLDADDETPRVLAQTGGDLPDAAWLRVFALGSSEGPSALTEVLSEPFRQRSLVVLIGRARRPFRAHERRRLAAMVGLADARWHEWRLRQSLLSHPSGHDRAHGHRPVRSQSRWR